MRFRRFPSVIRYTLGASALALFTSLILATAPTPITLPPRAVAAASPPAVASQRTGGLQAANGAGVLAGTDWEEQVERTQETQQLPDELKIRTPKPKPVVPSRQYGEISMEASDRVTLPELDLTKIRQEDQATCKGPAQRVRIGVPRKMSISTLSHGS